MAPENSIRMYNWARELQNRGHRIIFLSEKPHRVPLDVPFKLLPLRLKNNYFKFWVNKNKVERELRNFRADVVHAFYTTNYGVLATRQRVCPSVVTIGGSDLLIEPRRHRFFKWVNQYISKRATILNPVSEPLNRILETSYGVKNKSEIFPAGIDGNEFHPAKDRAGRPLRVISTRNFKPVYNQKLLIRAIPQVLEQFTDVQFVFLGAGPERENLERQLSSYAQVKWYGWQPRENLSYELRHSHIYVSTSLSDGTSSSLLEAMASGTFPIVTDIPANREWIDDGINGFIIPTDDGEVLARRLIDAMGDDELRKNAEKMNRDLVLQKADVQKIVSKLEKIYSRIAKEAE